MADAVDLCATLVRFDTTNRGHGDAEGEREAAEFVAGVLSDAGVEPKVLESAPRRANVLARIPGSDPALPALLVQGHLMPRTGRCRRSPGRSATATCGAAARWT
jgi:acetylornithine deacetylase/succinyl-diaminopimelate desuccinylase-like protein